MRFPVVPVVHPLELLLDHQLDRLPQTANAKQSDESPAAATQQTFVMSGRLSAALLAWLVFHRLSAVDLAAKPLADLCDH